MSTITAIDIIAAKRDSQSLSDAEIAWIIDGYTRGLVADEQMSALLMAILLNGMDARETARWTEAMVASGGRLDLRDLPRPTVDKHSTGGVGDKISLVLVPLVAACGAAVPQMAGRGLGHTGGTLDKMEAIPGWRPDLSAERIRAQLSEVGGMICAASADLAPADRRLYALRDATATVPSIPMIAASIMSKKIAEGTERLVLDVKVGSGAFMKDVESAATLARTMVDLGSASGVAVSALLTDMSTPLGHAVGNAVEVEEAVAVLAGGGPDDVVMLTLALAEEMLRSVGIDTDPERTLRSGKAMDTWRAMVRAQGGDPDAALPRPRYVHTIRAAATGCVARLDALSVAQAARRLGAGRNRKEDSVQAAAGLKCLAKPGDRVALDAPLFELYTDDEAAIEAAAAELALAVEMSGPDAAQLPPSPLILSTIRADGALV